MGQQMFIIALLASFLVSIAIIQLREVWDDSSDIAMDQFQQEQVLNLSSSGVNMAISRLRQSKTWRAGYSDVQLFNGGYINVKVEDIGVDSVRITSVGSMGEASHTAIVEVMLTSAVPVAESAMAIAAEEVTFSNAGKAFSIDGNDHDVNGVKCAGEPKLGISVSSPDVLASITGQLVKNKVTANILGIGGAPSVGVGTITNDKIIELRNMFRDIATITLPPGHDAGNHVYGSLAQPEIVYVGGSKRWTGRINGTGVLVVDGSLKMGGNVRWTGLVISVTPDVDVEFGDSGNPEINGATMIATEVPTERKLTNVKINGNPRINYSNSALTTVMTNLGMNEVRICSYYE